MAENPELKYDGPIPRAAHTDAVKKEIRELEGAAALYEKMGLHASAAKFRKRADSLKPRKKNRKGKR